MKKHVNSLTKLEVNIKGTLNRCSILAGKLTGRTKLPKYLMNIMLPSPNEQLRYTDDIPLFESYMKKSKENSMYLSDCTDDEKYSIIKDLMDERLSDIPIKLIKN